jgi:hypothetical protein
MAFKKINRLTMAEIQDRIAITGECWNWTGKPYQNSGYCRVKVSGQTMMAHRAVYEALVGPIPDGLQLDHLCRNRRCVNPTHLEPVTAKVNQARGTSPASLNAAKTHCSRGHELVGANVFVRKDGRRRCQVCERAHQKRLKQRPDVKAKHAARERERRAKAKEIR